MIFVTGWVLLKFPNSETSQPNPNPVTFAPLHRCRRSCAHATNTITTSSTPAYEIHITNYLIAITRRGVINLSHEDTLLSCALGSGTTYLTYGAREILEEKMMEATADRGRGGACFAFAPVSTRPYSLLPRRRKAYGPPSPAAETPRTPVPPALATRRVTALTPLTEF
ncbi:hypothetical protein EVAR_60328_1 [Eumeta japonica]|uniref:Uncharacterized protein n=1 Tax=Eumeta variegata TaxID=151549 RepID=A0A4C1Z9P8_EUMVA|nr:hypothetical protein EVAR_60328_1 [Eumeta japonica]